MRESVRKASARASAEWRDPAAILAPELKSATGWMTTVTGRRMRDSVVWWSADFAATGICNVMGVSANAVKTTRITASTALPSACRAPMCAMEMTMTAMSQRMMGKVTRISDYPAISEKTIALKGYGNVSEARV
jgi:hypothetical protein